MSLAYDIRSRNVHALTDLPPEAWVFTGGADTESPPGVGTMLSLEGLSRLARHVVRSYVTSAPTGTDATFNWRAAIPGQMMAELAAQYWIWQPDGLTKDTAVRYLDGFIRHLNDVKAGRAEGVADMNGVLGRIETLAPGMAASPAGTAMIALYVLWHRNLPPEHHRAGARAFLAKHQKTLIAPSVTAFAAGLLADDLPAWSDDQWFALATSRRQERATKKSAQPLPPELDAALLVIAAYMLLDAGRENEAARLAGWAVEEMPGNKALCAWEASIAAGQPVKIDLTALILGIEPSAAPELEVGNAIDAEPEAPPPPDGDRS